MKATSPMSGVRTVKVLAASAGSNALSCEDLVAHGVHHASTLGASAAARGVGFISAPIFTKS